MSPVAVFSDPDPLTRLPDALFNFVDGWTLGEAAQHHDYTDIYLQIKTIGEIAHAVKVSQGQPRSLSVVLNAILQWCQDHGIFVPDLTLESFRYAGSIVYVNNLKLIALGNSRLVDGNTIEVS